MRGLKIFTILKALVKESLELDDLVSSLSALDVVFSDYGTSLGTGLRQVARYHEERLDRQAAREARREREIKNHEREQKVLEYIYKLKSQGLIIESEKDGLSLLSLSPDGHAKLRVLERQLSLQLPDPRRYSRQSAPTVRIIVFDIPEKQAHKRAWLRIALAQLGFKKLQQSVWIGRCEIPGIFLKDLTALRLTECVEILAVEKTGSVRQLI